MKSNPEITKFANAFNLCEKNGVKIYPKPLSAGSNKQKARVRLITEYADGTITTSEDTYNQDSMSKTIFSMYIAEAELLESDLQS